jgi:uncharacterized protein (TIGR02996 family)
LTDHDALLRAIIENPAEDTPRLVFADWLDEHADAFPDPSAARSRAAFIRDDIALSQLDEFDPLRLRWELLDKPRRENEPWANASLPRLPIGLSFGHDSPVFRRGFPWALTAPGASELPVPSFPEVAAPIECVRLGRCGSHTIAALRRAPWRDRLTAVEFDQRGPASPTDVVLEFAPDRIERVAFLNEAINSAEARYLLASPRLGRLTSLRIARAQAGAAVAAALIHGREALALRELHLVGCRVPRAHLDGLLASPAVAALHALSLGGDLIGHPQKLHAFASLNAPALRSLDLSDEVPPIAAIEAFLTSPGVPRLHRLDLARCSLNRERTGLLATGKFDNLRVLRLYGNSVGNEGAAALARSPHLANLLVLDLGHAQVGDEGVLAILESPLADRLVLLDLTGSPASEETKEELVGRMGDRVRV